MSKKRKLPLVVIEWRDHAGSDGDWIAPSDIEHYSGGHEIISVGWLYRTTKKEYIILATYDLSKRYFGDMLNIVKGPHTKKRHLPGFTLTIEEDES